MLHRSILIRGACIALALAGLVVLADGMARRQLAHAVKASRTVAVPAAVRVAGAAD